MNMPKPEITELSQPYWDALHDGHLTFQRCSCGHAWLPARTHCPECLKPEPRWERASGKGTLISWVIYHVAYHPAFASRLPYNVALVQLDEGPRLLTNIVDDNEALVANAHVKLKIEQEAGTALARFQLIRPLPEPTIDHA
ncbi:OB-fold domain-containing protein [Alcaligenaceae bacterium]|nr:OB-fold domain-containing protein [Alcaligenaceae bacterium]